MTAEEKGRVDILQRCGLGYRRISKLTGLPLDTVKSHCRTHPLDPDPEISPDGFCKGCGLPIYIIRGHRPRQFCSDQCRMRWWNSHPNAGQRRAKKR